MTRKEPYIYLCEPAEDGASSDSDGWDAGWYYSDEAEDLIGPYPTREDAKEMLAEYVEMLDGRVKE